MTDKPAVRSTDHSIRSYVLRQGRFTKAQRRAWYDHADCYIIPAALTPPNWENIFARQAPLLIEIGSGYGAATIACALAHPDVNYVAFEVHRPGVGALMNRLAAEQIYNVRIICADAIRYLPVMFADNSVAGVNIFFPDPWPKVKHHKRRLLRPVFVEALAAKVAAGSRVHVVSDCGGVITDAAAVFAACGKFSPVDNSPPIPDTAFATRAVNAGREIKSLYLRA